MSKDQKVGEERWQRWLHLHTHGLVWVIDGALQRVSEVGGIPTPLLVRWLQGKKVVRRCMWRHILKDAHTPVRRWR
jgi:hypothetical protein